MSIFKRIEADYYVDCLIYRVHKINELLNAIVAA